VDPEKDNFNRVLRRDHPTHVCYPVPSRAGGYWGAGAGDARPSPDAKFWRDEWNVGWTDCDGEVFPTHPSVDSYEKVDDVPVPDPRDPRRMEPVEKLVAGLDREKYFLALGHSYFLYERVINILGPEEFGVSMLAAPDAAGRLLDRINEFNLAIAEQYLRFRPEHINIMDDFGHQDRLAMSPACWWEFFKPRLKAVVDFYRGRLGEVTISLHSCGCVMEILPDLVEIGLDILHPVQTRANDVPELRRVTAGAITLAGAIDGQHVLPFGSPEDVRREVFTKCDLLWEGGGYLPMPEKNIGVPRENFEAMDRAIRDWSRANVES